MLELSDLGEGRLPAISPAVGGMLAEAAGVCLEAEGHAPGVQLLVRGYRDASYRLTLAAHHWASTTSVEQS